MPTPCLHVGCELQDGKLRETIMTLGTPLEIRQGYPREGRVTTDERQPPALKRKVLGRITVRIQIRNR